MDEKKYKHLEFLQSNISRMNSCSFQMKGWCIAVVSALLAIYAASITDDGKGNYWFIVTGIVASFLFWGLDTYYLSIEKKFVKTYNIVAGIDDSGFEVKDFELYPDFPKTDWNHKLKLIVSPSVAGMYGTIVCILAIALIKILFY